MLRLWIMSGGVVSGWVDVGLSERGRRECVELKRLLRSGRFDVVFCSDLRRAVDSAGLVFGDSADLVVDERLREVDYGDFTGKPSEFVDSVLLEYVSKPFPNGESCMDVERRVRSFLSDLVENHSGKRIAVVSHRVPQLSLDVIVKGYTWEQAVKGDWRLKNPKEWKPGWKYRLRLQTT